MSEKDKKLEFNGGWSMGEAAHHVGKKMTTQTVKSKKAYNRKEKHKKGWKKEIKSKLKGSLRV